MRGASACSYAARLARMPGFHIIPAVSAWDTTPNRLNAALGVQAQGKSRGRREVAFRILGPPRPHRSLHPPAVIPRLPAWPRSAPQWRRKPLFRGHIPAFVPPNGHLASSWPYSASQSRPPPWPSWKSARRNEAKGPAIWTAVRPFEVDIAKGEQIWAIGSRSPPATRVIRER